MSAFGDQLAEDFAAFRGLQVQGDALHAAIVGFEIGAGQPGHDGRAARIVADLRHLDLDDLGAEIGHQHVGHRAGLRGGAGDHLDALERTVRLSHVERSPVLSVAPLDGPILAVREAICRDRPAPTAPRNDAQAADLRLARSLRSNSRNE